MSRENAKLIQNIKYILNNIENHGIERYDVSDVRKLKIINNKDCFSKMFRKVTLLIENIAPLFLRRIFRIKKTKFPTTYSHLIEAYLKIYKNECMCSGLYNIEELIDDLLKTYYIETKDVQYWKYETNNLYVDDENENKIISMPMHALARINISLIKYAKEFNKSEYLSLSAKSLNFTINNHNIFKYNSGAIGISYFYNSSDCTINVNTEFAQWLAMIPLEFRDENMHSILSGIIKLVIEEQNEDGSWFYFSKSHMIKWGDKSSIDCHHTGTVLYNLISIYKLKCLEFDEQNKLIKAIDKGTKYYLNSFFDKKTGQGITLLNYRRPAGPVQYSEAIIALCEYITLGENSNQNIYTQVKELLPKLVNQAMNLINKSNGSVASEKIILWKKINSIRWGNGPLLQALATYLEIKEIYFK